MWQDNYGKEPFDLRLTILRFLFRFHWILLFTIIGTLLFGGGYCVKNIVFRPERMYQASAIYKLDYTSEKWAEAGTYINGATWNTWLHTEEFLTDVKNRMAENAELTDFAQDISQEELKGMLSARVDSDLRIPTIIVTTNNPQLSVYLSKRIEEVITIDFAKRQKEDIQSVRVIDSPKEAEEVLLDVRPLRAFVLSGILSFFFVTVIFLLKELSNDSIWLPASLGSRYGLKVIGTPKSIELDVNLEYLFGEKKKVAVCSVDGRINTKDVTDFLGSRERCAENKWIPAPGILLCPECCQALREAEGIVLTVEAGNHVGKPLEYALEILQQQDCKITGVILWNPDERLIKAYYQTGKLIWWRNH